VHANRQGPARTLKLAAFLLLILAIAAAWLLHDASSGAERVPRLAVLVERDGEGPGPPILTTQETLPEKETPQPLVLSADDHGEPAPSLVVLLDDDIGLPAVERVPLDLELEITPRVESLAAQLRHARRAGLSLGARRELTGLPDDLGVPWDWTLRLDGVLIVGGALRLDEGPTELRIPASRLPRLAIGITSTHAVSGAVDVRLDSTDLSPPIAASLAEGEFLFAPLPPSGIYEVCVEAEACAPACVLDIVFCDRERERRLDIELERAAELRGIVLDPEGEPLPGAAVRVKQSHLGVVGRLLTTDDEGRFVISGLAPAERTTVRTDETLFLDDEVVLASVPAEELELRLAEPYFVEGWAVYDDGEPYTDNYLRGDHRDSGRTARTLSIDEDGHFVIGPLPRGQVTLWELLSGGTWVATTDEFAALEIPRPKRHEARLRLADETGAPLGDVTGTCILICKSTMQGPFSFGTDEHGVVELRNVWTTCDVVDVGVAVDGFDISRINAVPLSGTKGDLPTLTLVARSVVTLDVVGEGGTPLDDGYAEFTWKTQVADDVWREKVSGVARSSRDLASGRVARVGADSSGRIFFSGCDAGGSDLHAIVSAGGHFPRVLRLTEGSSHYETVTLDACVLE